MKLYINENCINDALFIVSFLIYSNESINDKSSTIKNSISLRTMSLKKIKKIYLHMRIL